MKKQTFDTNEIIIGDSWNPNITLTESEISNLQDNYDKELSQISPQERLNHILFDLQKKVITADKAFNVYNNAFKNMPPAHESNFGRYEHGERKITSTEDYKSEGVLKKYLNEYLLNKQAVSYSFSTLTKLCIEQGIGRDKILEFKHSLEEAFPKHAAEYSTYQECQLNSVWSSLNIAASYRLPQLMELLSRLVDTEVGEAELQLMRVKNALPFNILMHQQLYAEDFEEVFNQCEDTKQLTSIMFKSLEDAYKINPVRYKEFAGNNKFFSELLVKYGLNTNDNPAFKDVLTFISSHKILSSFEEGNIGATSSLKKVYEKAKKLIGDTAYFEADAFYRLGVSSDEEFSLHSNNQEGKTAKALCLWSRFFVQDNRNQTITARPRSDSEKEDILYKSQNKSETISPLKNVQIKTKENILMYEEGSDDDEWCVLEKISEHLPQKVIKPKGYMAKVMNQDYKQMVKLLEVQAKSMNAKDFGKQHDTLLNNTQFQSFDTQFNKTFIKEISQPSINIAVNQSHDKSVWLGEMLQELTNNHDILEQGAQQLVGDANNILDGLNLND